MGRGDSRTRRGKIFKGSYGNRRSSSSRMSKAGKKEAAKK